MKRGQSLWPAVMAWIGITAAYSGSWAGSAPPSINLPALGLEADSVTVSGLSSGAFMAVQMQVAHSASIKGAAVFGGGPFGCARGDGTMATLTEAAAHCQNVVGMPWNPISSFMGPPDTLALMNGAQKLEEQNKIDALSNIRNHRVFLFSGISDTLIPQAVMQALGNWYGKLMPASQIETLFDVNAGHGMLSLQGSVPCPVTRLPYINDCHMDGAGRALSFLMDETLQPADKDRGTLFAFSQRPFVPNTPTRDGMHETGHVFIPDDCTAGETCRLHVAFHGCQQNQFFIGNRFFTETGYNQWAASNRIVVLYPQVSAAPLYNPAGCWDWWGYTNQDYLNRDGIQIRSVRAMINQLTSLPMESRKKPAQNTTGQLASR